MRPTRISVEGFSAYRSQVEVDLEDVEFFALSGPTGAGKSSLVDAMIFALYGRVPRLGARVVAPVITAGADRARVALEFEVDGVGYVVSRVAERTETGATVREARLEKSDGTPLASGAGEVTGTVEELLRLRFDDFTKTVVLPQGEFARFLKAGSKERRDLLRDLLGLEIYTRMRELANVRRSVASERLGSARSQLDSLEVPKEGAQNHAEARLARLEGLAEQIDERLTTLEKAEGELEAVDGELATLNDAMSRLQVVNPPDHLEEMEVRLSASREAEALADRSLMAKHKEIEDLETRLGELPSDESLRAVRKTYGEIDDLGSRIGELDIEKAETLVAQQTKTVEEAETALNAANEKVASARVSHAAHAVATTLKTGEVCPVCAQEITEIPQLSMPEELGEVEEAAARADERSKRAREQLGLARVELTELIARRSEMIAQREKLTESVTDAPSAEELDDFEKLRFGLSSAVADARSELSLFEASLKEARRNLEDISESVRSVGRALMMTREQIADLRPPYSESDDPTVQWKDLLAWRDEHLETLTEERSLLKGKAVEQSSHVSSERAALIRELKRADVPAVPPFAVQVAREVEVARQRVEKIRELTERAKSLEKQAREAIKKEAIAGSLAAHLKANGFERWLMAGAITGLVVVANELLAQLSDGGYSLESDEDGSFSIIDHRNADELRDVATLSGGETFLVSLALSLSLAETLSGSGGAGLDAIILDEGFGTLDEESLDIVAAVLEELAGRGLMVGVITHVKELAARAPVRYQVTREPEGSRVEVIK